MLDARLREVKEQLLRPIVAHLAGVHPSVVTAIGLLVGMIGAVVVWRGYYGLGLLLWCLNRLLDGLDGTLARVHQRQSDFGGYLDILADFVIYAAYPVALMASTPSETGWLALAGLLSVYYVNTASWMYLAAILEKRQATTPKMTTVYMPDGLIGGTETFIFYVLFLLFPGQLVFLFGLMALLVVVTIVQRLLWAILYFRQA
jgi:phosphatidylglycerophosphate synthase